MSGVFAIDVGRRDPHLPNEHSWMRRFCAAAYCEVMDRRAAASTALVDAGDAREGSLLGLL
jgi:hypothetical protein